MSYWLLEIKWEADKKKLRCAGIYENREKAHEIMKEKSEEIKKKGDKVRCFLRELPINSLSLSGNFIRYLM